MKNFSSNIVIETKKINEEIFNIVIDERCDFKIIGKNGSDLLHQCADIIAGVARDNLHSKNHSMSYILS